MNKLELNPTIQEIINIKYVEVLMDKLYKEELVTTKEHELLILQCEKELKKELEANKKSIDKSNEKIKSINKTASDFKDLLDDLEESRLGGYKLNHQQKERLKGLLKEVESLTDYFDNYKNIINKLSSINDNLKYQKEENRNLNRYNNELIVSNRKLTNELKEQKNANELFKTWY